MRTLIMFLIVITVLLSIISHYSGFDTNLPIYILGVVSIAMLYVNHLLQSKVEEKREIEANLEARIQEGLKEKIEQDHALEQQAKMAAMGEMMDAVAHQWKQPLNALTMYETLLKSDFKDGIVDQAYIDRFLEDTTVQINHMVNTLDEFRDFFRPNQAREIFKFRDSIASVLRLVKDEFLKNRIIVKVDVAESICLEANENEIKHLMLNIINNSKDAFNEQNIQERIITIKAANTNHSHVAVEFIDNAGGIPEHIIDKVFRPNVTTKAADKGTGIGLYMSMQIANKHHGSLAVENVENGALFRLILPIVECPKNQSKE
ncbi:MAG: HAMP domain-containing histidine kinase [Campylobacterales bacterium]|nr:HAMP domain-containing histidine kinase [Campylobacterales bacterium]